MSKAHHYALIALLCLFAAPFANESAACSCVERSPCQIFNDASAVFLGDVTEVQRSATSVVARMPACSYFPSREGPFVWTLVCGERGNTGIREAVVTTELMSAGTLTIEGYEHSWAQDPYDPAYRYVDRSVLRFMSDDERYDDRFPDHPLSKVRRVLNSLPTSVEVQPDTHGV